MYPKGPKVTLPKTFLFQSEMFDLFPMKTLETVTNRHQEPGKVHSITYKQYKHNPITLSLHRDNIIYSPACRYIVPPTVHGDSGLWSRA